MQPGTHTQQLRRDPGGRATDRRPSAQPKGDKCVRLAPSRAKTRQPWQANKVCTKGSSWVPLLGASSSNSRFQTALESGTGKPRGVPGGCLPVGEKGCPPALPQRLSVSAPAARQLSAPVGPGLANIWIGSWEPEALLSPGAPRRGKRGAAWLSGIRFLLTPPAELSPDLEPLAFLCGPRPGFTARRAQRPALPWAPKRRRAGAAGQDMLRCWRLGRGRARLAPEPGEMGRAPRPGHTRNFRTAGSGAQTRSGGPTRIPGHRLASRRSREGFALFATQRKAPLQPSSVPTHPRPARAPRRWPGRSPGPKSC